MAHQIKVWEDFPKQTTPINAASLQDLELRLGAYADLRGPILNVMDPSFGAKGDGVTDDTVAARACYDAANLFGGKVIWPAGKTFKINGGGGALAVSSRVVTEMYGATIDISGASSGFKLFNALGTVGAHVNLTADSAVAGTSVSVANGAEAAFAADTLALVGSEDYYETRTELYGVGTGQKLGEICEVQSTAVGVVNFWNRLAGGYHDNAGATQLNYKTAHTAFIAPITPVENVRFMGGKIKGTTGSGTGSSQIAIQIGFGRHCSVRDVEIVSVANVGVYFFSCIESHVDNIRCKDIWNTNTGYAVNFGDATQDCSATNIRATKCRHAFTTTSGFGTWGVTRRCEVNGKSYYTHSTGDAWDSHAAAEDITYRNCESHSSDGQGLNFEGSRCQIIGGHFNYSRTSGIGLHNETRMPASIKVKGANILKPGMVGTGHGIRYDVSILPAASTDIWCMDIDVNVRHPPSSGVFITGSATKQLKGAQIRAHVDYSQSGSAAIMSQYWDNVDMVACVVTNLIAANVGCRQDNCVDGSIVGCNFSGIAGTPNASGAYVKNASRINIVGNTASGIAKGVNLDPTSADCFIDGNNLSTCTIPINPGGTGQRYGNNDTGANDLQTLNTDANFTLTNQASAYHTIHTGTLTANRVITLAGLNSYAGARFKVTRTGAGAFNLDLGGLKNLVTNTWAEVMHDGTNWVLVAYGAL